jgi:hypothetical protein
MTAQLSELTYPFEDKPQPGDVVAVAPGVFWLRMPLRDPRTVGTSLCPQTKWQTYNSLSGYAYA